MPLARVGREGAGQGAVGKRDVWKGFLLQAMGQVSAVPVLVVAGGAGCWRPACTKPLLGAHREAAHSLSSLYSRHWSWERRVGPWPWGQLMGWV